MTRNDARTGRRPTGPPSTRQKEPENRTRVTTRMRPIRLQRSRRISLPLSAMVTRPKSTTRGSNHGSGEGDESSTGGTGGGDDPRDAVEEPVGGPPPRN